MTRITSEIVVDLLMSVTLGGDLRQALAELCQAQLELVYLFSLTVC